MDVISPFIANLGRTIAIEPGQGALHDPTRAAQALAGLDLAPRNARGDTSLSQSLPASRIVVPPVGVQFVRSLSWSSTPSFDRLNGIKRCLQHIGIMDFGDRQAYGEWDSVSVGHNVALRARFAAIRSIRAGFGTPGAGTLTESSDARNQSIRFGCPSLSSSTWCILDHTSACCQSRRHRQQVIPLPQPISWGSISHGMPLRNTNNVPLRASRFAPGCRPPMGAVGARGNKGAMIVHDSSGSNSFAMCPSYHFTWFC
jgi:hypothetical protein